MDVRVRTCKICKRPCTEPKFLPCTHSFCKLCLKFQIIKVPTNHQWEGFSCPSCNTYTKAINPDQPLATWADQFPDSLTRKRVMKKLGSSEEYSDSVSSPTTPRFPSLSGSESPGRYSPVSSGQFSPAAISPGINSLNESQNSELFMRTRSTAGSDLAMSASPLTPKSPGVFSFEESEASSPEICAPSTSKLDDTDSVWISQEFSELSFSSPTSTNNTDNDDNYLPTTLNVSDIVPLTDTDDEETMCTIHPWKPVIVSCTNCNSIACGQCLRETHPDCKGEYFLPITKKSLLPDISELEKEIHKVDQANDMIKSSAYQLQQTRELIRQKIKQIALLLIQKMKREEDQMVRRVEQVYQDEIRRLKSGINPSEDILKQVQNLKDKTEDLGKQHPASIVHQADTFQENYQILLNKVKAVDNECVPPEVTFVPNYDTLGLTLGDLIVDEGYYPKHDIPPKPARVPKDTKKKPEAVSKTPESVQAVSEAPQSPEVEPTANSGKTKGSDQTGKQKSKTKSLFDKIRSPKQKQSKFFVKIPEL